MVQTVIEMIPEFAPDLELFEYFLDPYLPELPIGIPTPLPVRVGLWTIQKQIQAGQAIAAGEVAGKSQYVGQAKAEQNALALGYNLIYQTGGIKI